MFRSVVISLLALSTLGAVARTRPHYGGTLHVETQDDPWQEPDGIARRLVFDTLTRTDAQGKTAPALAIRWESQNSGHRWQFWLRSGVHFHDGSLLTADAVVQSLSQSCRNGCGWNAVKAVDNSVVFTCDVAAPELPEELSRSIYGIQKEDATQQADGTGPFHVVAAANGVLTLGANEDSWQGRPFVDDVEIRSKRAVREQWQDLAIGRADLVEVPPTFVRQVQQEHLNLLTSRPTELLYLSLSTAGILHEDQYRQAAALAVDRASLYQVVFQKQGKVTASLLPEDLSGYSFLFSPERDLANAHGPRTTSVPLTLVAESADASLQLAGQRLALNLRDVGFNAQFSPQLNRPGADLVLRRVHLESGNAAAGLLEIFSVVGEPRSAMNVDPVPIYRLEKSFLQKYRVIPLLYFPRSYAVGPHVRNLKLSFDGIPIISDVSLEESK